MFSCYTGIKEVDFKIFLEVEEQILMSLCQTNRYIYQMSKAIWYDKITNIFPGFPEVNVNSMARFYHKIKNFSYVQIEKMAVKNKMMTVLGWLDLPASKINLHAERGEYNEARLYIEKSIFPRQKSIDLLASTKTNYFHFEERFFDREQRKNRSSLIDLLSDHKLYPAIDIALISGYNDIVIEMLNNGFKPNQKSVNFAFKKCMSGTAEILLNKRIFPDEETVNNLDYRRCGNDFVQLLTDHEIYQNINIVAAKGYHNILRKLLDKGEKLSSETVDFCIKAKNNDILLLLYKYKFWIPDEKFINDCFSLKYFEAVVFLAENKVIDINVDLLNNFIEKMFEFRNLYIDKLTIEMITNLMIQYQVFPDQSHIDLCFKEEETTLMNYFILENRFPSQTIVNNFCKSNNYIMVMKLIKFNLFPEQDAIDFATDNNYQYVTNILAKYGK